MTRTKERFMIYMVLGKLKVFLLFILTLGPLSGSVYAQSTDLHTFRINNTTALKKFFRYSEDRIPLISAHRGGAGRGFPENCIATFENTLKHTFALLEIDPRLTKDSVIVLMHDATLDRTTNGTGRVSEHTLEELKRLKLTDPEGNITEFTIPTLDEVLVWAKGKTVLILDKKSVPLEVTEKKIREYKAESYAMVMAYSYDEAERYHALNKNIIMEIFIPNRERLSQFDETDVPWENVVAFIAHKMPEDKGLYDMIHNKGTMCIVGSSRQYDREYLAGETDVYEKMIRDGVDIIEADLAIQAGMAIKHLLPEKSGKRKYLTFPRLNGN